MPKRRKFLAGLGALATGTAAAVGTGAVSSVSAGRSATVALASDSNAFLQMEAGPSAMVKETNNTVELKLDGTWGNGGSGVNMDAVTTIGNPDNPSNDYAFKIKNQGTRDMMFKMNYFFENIGWVNNYDGDGQSHLKFEVFDVSTGGNDNGGSASRTYPNQVGNGRQDRSLGNPVGQPYGRNSEYYRFDAGEELYIIVSVDTTAPDASKDDDLSGTAIIQAKTNTQGDSWTTADPSTWPNEAFNQLSRSNPN